jgi:hypothetical protein
MSQEPTFFLHSAEEISKDAWVGVAHGVFPIVQKGEDALMSRSNQWVCLAGGVFLLLLGLKRLFQEGDWVIAILSVMILAFSTSSIIKSRQKR